MLFPLINMNFFLLLMVFIIAVRVTAKQQHNVVRACDTLAGANNKGVIGDSCRYFVVVRNHIKHIVREIVNASTMTYLAVNVSAVPTIDSLETLTARYRIGENMPCLTLKPNPSADDIIADELAKITAMTGHLIEPNMTCFGVHVNPSVVLFRGQLLFATGQAWGAPPGEENRIEFQWLNYSGFPLLPNNEEITSTNQSMGVFVNKTFYLPFTDIVDQSTLLVGQDPRLLVVDDYTIVVVYTSLTRPEKAAVAVLTASPLSNRLRVSEMYVVIEPSNVRTFEPQKNWTPFLYSRRVHLIQNYNPFIVSIIDSNDESRQWGLWPYHPTDKQYRTISATVAYQLDDVVIPWEYGTIRGGTNAILLEGGRYLTIFHSSCRLVGNFMKTYFMGALLFDGKPPFRPLAVSAYPIVDNFFYEGAYSLYKNRGIDYVVFPMGLTQINDTLVLSLGFNDWKGYIVRIKLANLLASLRPVTDDH
jgi:predicted GH43/DUF377 family glycosyl hydrolase